MAYCYEPLTDLPDDTIRILTINAGSSNQVTGSLTCVRLSDEPTFKALSYAWGPVMPQKSISIDGGTLSIRSNLWDLLDRLQRNNAPIRVWADAVCVNQEDLQERGHQVLLMGKIYGEAEQVYAWLGKEEPSIEIPDYVELEALSQLDVKIARARLHTRKHYRSLVDAAFALVMQLASNRYWTRIWIIQELLLARDVLLMYGAFDQLSLIVFAGLHTRAATLDNNWSKLHSPSTAVMIDKKWSITDSKRYPALSSAFRQRLSASPIDDILQKRYPKLYVDYPIEHNPSPSGNDLLSLVTRFHLAQHEDCRDRVYAMLSLVGKDAANTVRIVPDYAKSPADVFFNVLSTIENPFEDSEIFWGSEYTVHSKSVRSALGCTFRDLILSSCLNSTDTRSTTLSNALHSVKTELFRGLRKWADSLEPDDFDTVPEIEYSLRRLKDARSKDGVGALLTIIADNSERAWLGICFLARFDTLKIRSEKCSPMIIYTRRSWMRGHLSKNESFLNLESLWREGFQLEKQWADEPFAYEEPQRSLILNRESHESSQLSSGLEISHHLFVDMLCKMCTGKCDAPVIVRQTRCDHRLLNSCGICARVPGMVERGPVAGSEAQWLGAWGYVRRARVQGSPRAENRLQYVRTVEGRASLCGDVPASGIKLQHLQETQKQQH